MKVFVAALFFCGVAYGQVHLGPIGSLPEVDCYTCDDHAHSMPGCLSHVKKCHHDEVCAIKYGNGDGFANIHCKKAHDCAAETANPLRNCTGGGVTISGPAHHGPGHDHDASYACEKCCTDNTCVSELVQLIEMEAQQTDTLVCPGWCAPNDLDTCMQRAVRCRKGQFCKVQKEDGEIWGECKDDHEYNHCMDEKNKHAHEPHCQDNNHHHGHCITDCCNTNDCLSASFPGLAQANTTPAPTMDNTNMVNNGTTLWERLGKGKCADQLANDGCKTLIQTQNVCQDRLALDICPETCGLCAALGNGTVCQDTVINNGCPDLKANADVCNDALAVFICPTTCNMCNELVNSIITSLIGGTSNATDVPPSLLPPSANPSDFPTFDCSTLDTSNCGLLTGLCSSSFVNVVCPSQCMACKNPATTMMPTTAMPTTPMPTTAMPTTPMPTVQVPVNVTSPDDSDCADHLNGMPCDDLVDVCSSVLATSVCPKYCGLC